MSHPFGPLPTIEDAQRLRSLDDLAREYASARYDNEEAAAPLCSDEPLDRDAARQRLSDSAQILFAVTQKLAATVMIMTADGVFERTAHLIAGAKVAAE